MENKAIFFPGADQPVRRKTLSTHCGVSIKSGCHVALSAIMLIYESGYKMWAKKEHLVGRIQETL
ncbi:hypothetical protein [Bacillus smithii]|uniref:hypothetical protein n=1 Tax=Bacillus smithii TaxID=1479 RepID=UPI0002E06C62|nr:hypothetical protein [Bacillus smithii]